MWKLLFSFEGRINRATFWSVTIAVNLASFVGVKLCGLVVVAWWRELPREYWPTSEEEAFWQLFLIHMILGIPASWVTLAAAAKRWHDRDKSAAWILISLIPVIGWGWHLVECGFLRGTVGPNKYGPDPLEPKHPPETVSSGASVPSTVRVAAETSPVQDEVGEKYAMLLKYSDTAREADARLSKLPEELRGRFKQDIVANPDRIEYFANRIEYIATRILAENQKRLRPFGDPQLDALYQKLETYGPEAQAEFQRVLTFLKGQVDPEKVFIQIVAEKKLGEELKNVRLRTRAGVIQYVWNGERYGSREELHADILKRLEDHQFRHGAGLDGGGR